jgi:hypothetical protein
MNKVQFSAWTLVTMLAISGCLVPAEEHDHGEGDHHSEDAGEAATIALPTAAIVVTSNGSQVFPVVADAGSNETQSNETGGNETASAENETAVDSAASTVSIMAGENLTFDGSQSTGDNLSFAWTIGNATFENASFEHAFPEAGTFNVTLVVTDVHNQTAEAALSIIVELGGPAPGTPLGERTDTFTGADVLLGDPSCAQNGGGNAEKTFKWNLLSQTEDGTPAIAVKLVITATQGAAGYGHRLTLRDPAGTQLGQGTSIDLSGEFPGGEYTIVFRLCGPYSSGGASPTTAKATYVVAAS